MGLNDKTSSIGGSRRGRRKAALRAILDSRDTDGLLAWARQNANALSILGTLLFESDDLLRWRAIEAIGIVAKDAFGDDPEKVRAFLRRLFWLMNDESGGICWHAPEAIAEVLLNVPDLQLEFAVILMSYLEEEPFESGVCWAISRLAEALSSNDDLAAVAGRKAGVMRKYLAHQDPRRRASALMALRALSKPIKDALLDPLRSDTAQASFYDFDTGNLKQTALADLARTGE